MTVFKMLSFLFSYLNPICRLALIALLMLLSACGSFKNNITELGPTLADLPEAEIPESLEPVAQVSRAEVERMYRSALEVAEDEVLRQQIRIRLADIEMARSEDEQIASEEGGTFFTSTIAMYDELIKLQQEQQGVVDERLLYRVSKAYALDTRLGESDESLAALVAQNPDSGFAAEAQFRRAELAFSKQDYPKAYNLYTKVVAIGDDTPFYLNAIYMQGWSQFKLDKYHLALEPFGQVLDKILPEGRTLDALSPSQQNLLADTLKVTGFALSYMEGANSIAEMADTRGERHYQHLLYRQLGDLYMEKKRYRDAAETYSAFVTRYPDSSFNPEFSDKTIDVYLKGNFPTEILPAKEQYVQRFGMHSPYWQSRSPEQRSTYSETLATYLDELSSYYHAEAQALVKSWEVYRQQGGKQEPDAPAPYFIKAASYYEEIIKTFNQKERTPELTFLMAEALNDAGQVAEAVNAYEQVAYEFLDANRGGTAGYAAILALDGMIESAKADPNSPPERIQALEQHRIRSAIDFSDHYPADKRAVAVLTNAAERVYASGDREQAIILSTRLTQWQPPQSVELQKTAWLVLAHSQFETDLFIEAESSYRHVLSLLDEQDKDRPAVVDRIAASMYKLAEQEIANGAKSQAVNRLLLISNVAPGTELAINAQYDAATYLIEMEEWDRAERVLVDFQQRFPDNALAKTLPPKLAVIYQELEAWDKAAEQLAVMSSSESDPETRRSALYLSAELYQKSGKVTLAEKTYNAYIKKHPQPFDLALEARVQLRDMAKSRGDTKAYESRLRDLIKLDSKAGNARTERSTYLAAQSLSYFAAKDLAAFERISLRAPIKKTLKAKRKAMDKTLKNYKAVIDYGVAEFATEANHRIGEVYSNLYQELLDSEKPKGLDELTLEQYEIMLEEQAYPFKGKAVEMLAINAERSWEGFYDDWVKNSFRALEKLLPARYGKKETVIEVSHGIH